MNDKETEILELMSKAYADEAVKNNDALSALLFDCAHALTNGEEYKLLCVKLSGGISTYLLTHHFKAPEPVIDLFHKVSEDAEHYKAMTSGGMWLPNMFR